MSIEFSKKEIVWIIISIVIFTFIIIFPNQEFSILLLIAPLIIVLTNVITKKYAANYFNLKITYNVWGFQRYWFTTKSHYKKSIPMGLILPFFLSFFSVGLIKALTFLQFDYENNESKRMLKKRGRVRRQEVNETDPAFTAAWGFYALIILAIIGSLLDLITGLEIFNPLTKYSLYYGAWNLLPISNLDGTKIFFGNLFHWALLAAIFFISIMTTAGL